MDADHIGLGIGDVASHGLPEATVLAQLTAALRNIVPRCGTDPAAALDELNTFLGRYHLNRMATACYLVFDRRTGALTYARAGHPPPLLRWHQRLPRRRHLTTVRPRSATSATDRPTSP
ncbi:hypothetical protein GCM10010503_37250 [Streptomyces lucensis JCM 4490]|uniref:PPM-type phosphatase domain-containing protein n=1 Tax=Streptomyces lucensis JCM 4490 TaxID=1306176 RepID=A0A918MS26_9ACTN|nr:PP2C family protein-serine/threonine phosphatase [Streptomyces lucensis]GGW56609.1 hypothetical protein GCM10010503_37250 [Streptomyces lucensis JCM 4490]